MWKGSSSLVKVVTGSSHRAYRGEERFPKCDLHIYFYSAKIITKARVMELITDDGACLMSVWISASKTELLNRQTVECCPNID